MELSRYNSSCLGASFFDIGYAGSKGLIWLFLPCSSTSYPDSALSQGPALSTHKYPNPFFGYISNGLLASRTVARGQLLRPYPQFQNFQDTGGGRGDSHWNSLQTRMLKRFKGRAIISGSYTFSKLISNTDTLTSWLENHGTAGVQNWNNLRAEKEPRELRTSAPLRGQLHTFASALHEEQTLFTDAGPFFDRIVGGWGVNGITTLQSGFPLG